MHSVLRLQGAEALQQLLLPGIQHTLQETSADVHGGRLTLLA